MKKNLVLILFAFVLVYCHSKKKITETKNITVAAPKSELEIAQKRWAGATAEDLSKGKEIFFGKCTKCHGAKKIEVRSEKSWLHEIDDMSPKAHLTAEEKEKLTRFVLSYREAHTTTD